MLPELSAFAKEHPIIVTLIVAAVGAVFAIPRVVLDLTKLADRFGWPIVILGAIILGLLVVVALLLLITLFLAWRAGGGS